MKRTDSKSGSPIQWRAPKRLFFLLFSLLPLFFSPAMMHSQTAYSFPSAVPVGSQLVESIPVTVQVSGTLGSIHVLTLGVEDLDYTLATGCPLGVFYAAGATCTLSAQFAPLFPGSRHGAVVLLDSNGNLMATRPLSGVGEGPLTVMVAGALATVAGNGHLADDGTGAILALNTAIHEPLGLATDGAGNFFYTDGGNSVIRRVNAGLGTVATVAGTGFAGFSPSGTLAVAAQLNIPSQLVADGAGNLFFADSGNNAIREIVRATGRIVTIAGTGSMGYTGDSGPATLATLSSPQGLGFDAAGDLYIADTGNHVLRLVSAATGNISTFAGTGVAGFSPDGTTAATSQLNSPWGVFAAPDGSIYIADFGNNRVRRVSAANGTIATVAGTGNASYRGDDGLAVQADLNRPSAVVMDAAGDLFIADSENNCVRKVNGATQTIITIAGNGAAGYGGDGLDANVSTAELDKPYALSLDGAGNLLIADRLGLRIREVSGSIASLQFQPLKATNTSPAVPQTIENDGNAPLSITSIVATLNSAIAASQTTCSMTAPMAVGSSCVVGAQFKPATVGSPVTGAITINSNAAIRAATIDLSGYSLSIFPTSVTVTGSPNPAALGTAVTLTAAVTSPNTQPLTGTVSFYDGTRLLGGVAQILNSSTGTASYTTATLALGAHSITAVYSGDNGDSTSTSTPAFVELVKQGTTFTLAGAPNPATVYQQIEFTATLATTAPGGAAPAGNVVFSSDGNLLPNGTVALINGVAVYDTDLLAQGTHLITAVYAGDASDLGSSATPYTQTVNFAATNTAIATSSNSVPLSTPVTFTATVNGISTSTPTGNVVFKDGAATLGAAALSPLGVASFTTSSLSAGLHPITAVYQGDPNYGTSASITLGETILQIATSTAISPSTNPGVAGAAIQFAVTVTASSGTTPATPLSGKVTVTQGSTMLGSGNVTPGAASPAAATFTVSASNFTPGSQTITAVYAGDANYLTSGSSVGLTISPAATTTTLAASANTVIANKPVTLTATVAGNGGTPAGSVTFAEGATILGGTRLNGSGNALLTIGSLSVGTHAIAASYSGDTDDGASSSNVITIVVQSAATTVSLTPSLNPVDFGQQVTLTATVTGNGGVPTGAVTFLEGTTTLGTAALLNGSAVFSTASLSNGNHAITAAYSGDSNDTASTSATWNETVLQTITLSVAGTTANPSTARSNVHFVAIITALQGIQPTGSITFFDGAAVLGSSPIVGATASLDIATLAVGNHQIVASYAGDAGTEPMTSQPYLETVNAAGTTIVLVSSTSPATFGLPLVFSATASSTAGSLSGTVLFKDARTTIGQATLSAGVATLTTSTLTPGVHTITAAYQGDSNDAPASSAPLIQLVERATSTTLTSSQNPLLTLAPVIITAIVANGGTDRPTGTVNFSEDAASAGSAQLVNGVATLSLQSLPAGTHTFSATYVGDSVNLASSSAPFIETVQLRATTNALDSSATSLTGGQQITLSSIIRWTGSVTPTGIVTFLNGTTRLGSVAVDGQGLASLTVLLTGTSASLTSSYSGDAYYASSTSPVTTVPIGPAPNLTLTATPDTVTMQSGQHANVMITLTSVNKFTDTFALGCAGLPDATTCTFAQDKTTLAAGGVQTIVVTVDTGSPLLGGTLASNTHTRMPVDTGTRSGIAACLLVLCVAIPRKRLRRMRGLLLALCMAGVISAISGCASVQVNSTPAGSYTFQITAIGQTGVTQFVPVTMNITK